MPKFSANVDETTPKPSRRPSIDPRRSNCSILPVETTIGLRIKVISLRKKKNNTRAVFRIKRSLGKKLSVLRAVLESICHTFSLSLLSPLPKYSVPLRERRWRKSLNGNLPPCFIAKPSQCYFPTAEIINVHNLKWVPRSFDATFRSWKIALKTGVPHQDEASE